VRAIAAARAVEALASDKPCNSLGTTVTDHALNSNGPRRVGNRLAPHETGKADKESGDLVTRNLMTSCQDRRGHAKPGRTSSIADIGTMECQTFH
jgi:hypothetical protein